MSCANGGDYLHRHRAKQPYVVLPSELIDRIPDIYMAYLLQSQLNFLQSKAHSHLLQSFD
jgi:hypothetical protein